MRIFVLYHYDLMRKKTIAVDLNDENEDCLVLLKAVSTKIGYPIHSIFATVKKDTINVKYILVVLIYSINKGKNNLRMDVIFLWYKRQDIDKRWSKGLRIGVIIKTIVRVECEILSQVRVLIAKEVSIKFNKGFWRRL